MSDLLSDHGSLDTLRAGLRLLALRALGDPAAADDVAQEALARGLEAVAGGRLRDPRRLGSFFRAIARHVVADHIRRERRRVPLDPDGVPLPAPGALDALVKEEERARVRAALAELSPGDRELLRLSFFEDAKPREIAARLGEPPERIRKRKSRALERLRAALATPTGSRTVGAGDVNTGAPVTLIP